MKNILILLGAWSSYPSWINTFRWIWSINDNSEIFEYLNIDYIKRNKLSSIKFLKLFKEEFNNKKENYYHEFIKKISESNNINIISQNIDNLDYWLKNVVKIHWDIFKNKCLNNYRHNVDNKEIGDKCNICNSYIIPDILYYNEMYNKELLSKIKILIDNEYDYFIIIWSSLEISFIENITKKIKTKSKININPILELNEYNNFKTFADFKDSIYFFDMDN